MTDVVLLLPRGGERGLGVGQGAVGGGEAAPRGPHGIPQRPERAIGVEQVAVHARVQKAAVVLLSMQLHQRVGKAAQDVAGDAAVVDVGGLAAVGRDRAAEEQLLARGQAAVLQHRAGGMGGAEVEGGRDLADIGAGADDVGAATPAEDEPERIEQDRLPRPGLSGQDVEAGAEVELQPVDDQDVADVEAAEHGLPVRSAAV